MIRYALAVSLIVGTPGIAFSAALRVGAEQQYKMPSEAIARAHDGDTIEIESGTYVDCALVNRNNITIEGVGPNVIMTDKTCRGKAILITNGNNITIRNLTLRNARVPDQNGAGIRGQGGKLTVINSRFINNEDGILVGENSAATLRVIGSEFVDNGKCAKNCAHAIYVGPIAALDVENSRFYDTHEGHSIRSRAARTTVLNCDIEDGPDGTSSYQVDAPNGGTVRIEGNKMEKGPHAQNWGTAISIGEGGVMYQSDGIVIVNNTLINDTGHDTVFVRNITATPAQLSGNVFRGGKVTPLAGDGTVR
jgi:Right handed beta helix region